MKIIGKNIYMRLAEISDAEFMANLRADQKNRFLTMVDVESQRHWLTHYKEREAAKTEYYFIICTKTGENCGSVRVYDFIDKSFCWGSWLLGSNAPTTAGIESALLVYEFAFNHLTFNHCHFDVRVDNTKVRAFHERFGATTTKEDELDIYYEFPVETYQSIKSKYAKFLPEQVLYED